MEAREREEQLLEDERRRRQQQDEEEAELQRELLRLQELQHLRAAKKKRRERAKENTAPPQNSPQPLRQTAQNVLENLHNGKSQLLHGLIRLPGLPPFPPLLGKTQGAGLREFRTSGSQPPVRRPVMAWCSRDPPTNKYVFISETYFSRLLLLLEELVSGWDQDGTVLN